MAITVQVEVMAVEAVNMEREVEEAVIIKDREVEEVLDMGTSACRRHHKLLTTC